MSWPEGSSICSVIRLQGHHHRQRYGLEILTLKLFLPHRIEERLNHFQGIYMGGSAGRRWGCNLQGFCIEGHLKPQGLQCLETDVYGSVTEVEFERELGQGDRLACSG